MNGRVHINRPLHELLALRGDNVDQMSFIDVSHKFKEKGRRTEQHEIKFMPH